MRLYICRSNSKLSLIYNFLTYSYLIAKQITCISERWLQQSTLTVKYHCVSEGLQINHDRATFPRAPFLCGTLKSNHKGAKQRTFPEPHEYSVDAEL